MDQQSEAEREAAKPTPPQNASQENSNRDSKRHSKTSQDFRNDASYGGATVLPFVLKSWWSLAAKIGTRSITKVPAKMSSAFANTVFYFDGITGYVALTIDDGLAREADRNLVSEVRALLKQYNATATFFVCSDYLHGVEDAARGLAEDGHEFGNHCACDREYASLPAAEFESVLTDVNAKIEAVVGTRPLWFRAPQGKYTKSMQRTVESKGLRHALTDCYCDDWAISDPNYISRTMLRQVQAGSIPLLHMPEKGFREASLTALEQLLDGLKARGLQCVTLTRMTELAGSTCS